MLRKTALICAIPLFSRWCVWITQADCGTTVSFEICAGRKNYLFQGYLLGWNKWFLFTSTFQMKLLMICVSEVPSTSLLHFSDCQTSELVWFWPFPVQTYVCWVTAWITDRVRDSTKGMFLFATKLVTATRSIAGLFI